MSDGRHRPLVSLAITVDDPTWLEECLASAVAQDYPTTEIVVLAPTANDVTTALCAKHAGVRLVDAPEAAGLVPLIAATRGRYVKLLRGCDWLTPDCVSRLVEAIEQAPETRLAFALATQIDARGKQFGVEQRIQFASALQLIDGNALRRKMVRHCENLVGEPSAVLVDGRWLREVGQRAFRGRTTGHRFTALEAMALYCNAAENRPVAFARAALASCRTPDGTSSTAPASLGELRDWRRLIDEIGQSDSRFAEDRAHAINAHNNFAADYAAMHRDEADSALQTRFGDEANPHYRGYLACRALIEAGRMADALPQLLSLAEQKTSCWQVYDTLADIALARGEDKAALAYLEAATRKFGRTGPLTLKLATLLIGAYRIDEGRQQLDAYLERHPDDDSARALLASIDASSAAVDAQRFDASMLAAYACLEGDYERWQAVADSPRRAVAPVQRFEFVLIARTGNEAGLAGTIDTIAAQGVAGWRLTILADFAPPDPCWSDTELVAWRTCATATDIAAALPHLAATSDADWLVITEAGTRFAPDYLAHLAAAVDRHPGAMLVYADDDHLDADDKRCLPRFKPDFDPDYFYAFDYIRDVAIRRDALQTPPEAYAEAYDLVLGVLERGGVAAIAHIDHVLVHIPLALSQRSDDAAARRALARHFARRALRVAIEDGAFRHLRRLRFDRNEQPRVSIIVRGNADSAGLERLLAQTRYADRELLVVAPAECGGYPQSVRHVVCDSDAKLTTRTAAATAAASGDFLLFLDTGLEPLHDDWLEVMLDHACRPDIGVVGARLLAAGEGEPRLEHAGLVLGMGSGAGHVFRDAPAEQPGYLFRSQTAQRYSAVADACLLIRRALYREVGGLDHDEFGDDFAAVDLCLKLRERALATLWTPCATLRRTGTASPEQPTTAHGTEAAYRLFHRWRRYLVDDPAWNRNLCLATPRPTVESELVTAPADLQPDAACGVIGMPLGAPGAAHYRTNAPFQALTAAGLARCQSVCPQRNTSGRTPTPIELGRMAPQALLIHAPADDARLIALLHYQALLPNLLRIYSLDDLITDIPEDNPTGFSLPPDVLRDRLRIGASACQRAIVSTEPLAVLLREFIADVRVVPNMLERSRWGTLRSTRRNGPRPRVGWAGAQQHAGDLRFILDVVAATHREVDWVFFGMMPEGAQSFVAEYHHYIRDFDAYPAKLASLDLDLAIAPLVVHPFNEAKSNLRLLEYGICGWPVICTDVHPYRTDDPPVTRLPNDADAWIAAIRAKVADRAALAREGDLLRQWVLDRYILEDHLDRWLTALTPAAPAAGRT